MVPLLDSTGPARLARMTTASPNPLRRFSHGTRFERAVDLALAIDGRTVLDFGAGDGTFLRRLEAAAEGRTLVGFDPDASLLSLALSRDHADIEMVTRLDALGDRRFDLVTCFEVLEHFAGTGLVARISELGDRVAPAGAILVSVPIETGPALLGKSIVRAIDGTRHREASFGDVVAGVLGARRTRPAGRGDGYIATHAGFDHRAIPPAFARAGWVLTHTAWSPFPGLGAWCNSQVFYTFRRAEPDVERRLAAPSGNQGMD